MTLMRGLADDLPLMTWLNEHIWPAEARVLGAEFVRDGVELAIAEMLRGGTTCCNENYFFPDVQAATYLRHGFRAAVGLPFIEFSECLAKSRDEYFGQESWRARRVQGEALITTTLAPHAPYTVADEASSASACFQISWICRYISTCTKPRTRWKIPRSSTACARSRACNRSAWSTII